MRRDYSTVASPFLLRRAEQRGIQTQIWIWLFGAFLVASYFFPSLPSLLLALVMQQ